MNLVQLMNVYLQKTVYHFIIISLQTSGRNRIYTSEMNINFLSDFMIAGVSP